MADSETEVDSLLARLRQGDERALGELFSLHRERLWQIVHFRLDVRLTRRLDVDDVLQEAYLAAAQRIAHYFENPPSSFFIWLRTIVNQTMIDLHRRHLGASVRDATREIALGPQHKNQSTSISLAKEFVEALTSVSEAAMRAELVDQVEQAIDSMDAIDREVLVLRHFEELSNSEVAEVLKLTQAAASARYTRAILRLKQLLAQVPGVLESDEPGEPGSEMRKVG